MRLDSNGNFIWGKTYGGAGHDLARSVQQETNGSFIVLGRLWSGDRSIWLSNLDSNGNIIWQKTYRGYYADAISIRKTADGGHIISGEQNIADFFILKLDRDDNIFDCDIQGTGDVIVRDAPIASQNTNVSVQSPTVTVDNTHITPYDTSAVINTYCYYDSEDCEGNFDCDADVDGSDAALFKADFRRSLIENPCNNDSPCNGDFNCDYDCDGTDALRFKQDFGRSSLQNPCPVCVSGGAWCSY